MYIKSGTAKYMALSQKFPNAPPNINEKKIVNIYIVSDVSDKNLLNYVEASCFNKTIINK